MKTHEISSKNHIFSSNFVRARKRARYLVDLRHRRDRVHLAHDLHRDEVRDVHEQALLVLAEDLGALPDVVDEAQRADADLGGGVRVVLMLCTRY